ncbi:MAG: DivIVA domain-containing protein [Cyclobacteriaceae bacterium]|nr:DivIVA domain-containing protein [Cyclobacteriaceae bacterium]UYN86358.1 MAG: DivIVA domain-containing protein [Cyclobacteriaceae bacterium]
MKITPLEIRQKTFEKHFRGYDKDEVNAFLLTLSSEWERLVDEGKELRIKLEAAEREVNKLREVESSLYKTLKTAEDTGAHVIEQARQAADLHLRESQLKAEAMLNEAKMMAGNTIDEAEQRARQVLAEMEERLRGMVENYKKLESTRDDLLQELKRISQDSIERVERIQNNQKGFDADKHFSQARMEVKKAVFPNADNAPLFSKPEEPKKEEPKKIVVPEPVPEPQPAAILVEQEIVMVEAQPRKITSFFDEIG